MATVRNAQLLLTNVTQCENVHSYRWRLWRQLSFIIIIIIITSGSLQLSEYSDGATNRTAEVSDADWVSCRNTGGAHSGTGLPAVTVPLAERFEES